VQQRERLQVWEFLESQLKLDYHFREGLLKGLSLNRTARSIHQRTREELKKTRGHQVDCGESAG